MSVKPGSLNTTEFYSLSVPERQKYIEEVVSAYREKGGKMRDRHFEFIRSDMKHPSGFDVSTVHAYFMSSHFVAVGGAGACIGGIIGLSVGGPAAPATGLAGVALGAAIGGPIAAMIGLGTGYAVAEYKCRPTYKKFCERESNKEFHANLIDLIKKEKVFEPISCGIHYLPVVDGVRTPTGQIYERCAIEDWIEKSGTDPVTRQPLSKKDLIPDEETSANAASLFVKFLIEKKKETGDPTGDLALGYEALIQDTRNTFVGFYNGKIREIQKKYRKNEISYEAMCSQTDILGKRYLNLG